MASTSLTITLTGQAVILFGLLASITSGQNDEYLTFEIFEEIPAPFFVGDIIQSAELRTKLNASIVNNLEFSILTEGNENAKYFDIGSDDGLLMNRQLIDREVLCPRLVQCVLDLDIATHSPPDHFEVIKVKVTISDRNDNAPRFLQSEISQAISEGTSSGYSFTVPTADDVDGPQYGVKSYVMTSQSSLFELKVVENDDGSVSNLYIVLKDKLDREDREEYDLRVEARDGGAPPLTGALNVHITVLDLNDNFPVFDSDLYVAEVREDTAPGTSIYQVTATDPDAGANGEIVYGFTIQTSHSYGHLFTIRNTTGEIFVVGDLDAELTETCNLAVTAHDRSVESLLAESRVIVNIQDVNDNPPKITVNALTVSGRVELPESSPPGSFAAYLSGTDPDSGDNGEFLCILSDPSGKFQAEPQRTPGEFKLVSTGRVDHEETAEYLTEFTCRDNGQPALTSTKIINIRIIDENDNMPQFDKQHYSVIIKENNALGDGIIQVKATDPDSGKNGEILYSIVGDEGKYLDINPITGNISAAVVFDYEDFSNLTVKVVARDQGETATETFTFIHLVILDENDNAPLFNPTTYEFRVMENQDIGTDVGQVTASDADSLGYNDFQFYLQSSTLAMATFTIEPNSGRIFTRKPLDREEMDVFTLVVVVADRNKPNLLSTATVTIIVADENDNPPVLRFPSRYNNTIHVSNMAPEGFILTQISAIDQDEINTENSRLSYSFIRNSAKGVFSIEADTAAISVSEDLSRKDNQVYELVILVQDHGSPPLATETTLNVVVNKSLSFPHNLPGGQGSRDGSMGGQNLTIVIVVAVISCVLILFLIVAIVILRRQEQKRRSTNYLNVLFGDQTKLAGSGGPAGQTDNKTKHVKSNNVPNNKTATGSQNNTGYSNKVDINDETGGNRQENAGNEALYSRPQKQGNAAAGGNVVARTSSHLAQGKPRYPSPGPHVPGGYWGPDSQSYQIKEHGDNVSEPSEAASLNSDSGRGSNEDADSRPSESDQFRNNQGEWLRPPLYQHSPQGGPSNQGGLHASSPNQRQYTHAKVSQNTQHIDNRNVNRESQAHHGAQGMPGGQSSNTRISRPGGTRAHQAALANSYPGNGGGGRQGQTRRSEEGLEDEVFYISSNASHV